MDEQETAWAAALSQESAPEPEQVSTPAETPEADTLDQPVEEVPEESSEPETKSRSQERIKQLTREKNEARAEADYWKSINKQPEVLPVDESDDGVTLDQISNSVINKLSEREAQKEREQAAAQMRQDVAETVQAYPELDADDDLAAIVVAMAERRGISIRTAADRVMGVLSKEKENAEKRTLATQASRVGVSSPPTSPVGNGDPEPLDVSRMSESEKEANWERILAAHSN